MKRLLKFGRKVVLAFAFACLLVVTAAVALVTFPVVTIAALLDVLLMWLYDTAGRIDWREVQP